MVSQPVWGGWKEGRRGRTRGGAAEVWGRERGVGPCRDRQKLCINKSFPFTLEVTQALLLKQAALNQAARGPYQV